MSPSVRKNLWMLEFVAIAVMAYILAKMTINLVMVKVGSPSAAVVAASPSPSLKPAQVLDVDDSVIVSRNIFDADNLASTASAAPEDTGATPAADDQPVSGEPVLTSLDVQLVSTFSMGDGTDPRSNATLSTKETGSDGDVFIIGQSFLEGTKISKILFDRVIFTHAGKLEYVLLNDFTKGTGEGKAESPKDRVASKRRGAEGDEKAAAADAGQTKFTIARAELDKALENPQTLLTQIRAVPHNKDGKPSGLKITSVDTSGIFSKLGIKRGDILEKINGNVLSFDQGVNLFNSLKSESQFTMDVIRRGKSQTFEYVVQ